MNKIQKLNKKFETEKNRIYTKFETEQNSKAKQKIKN
jgi:hypothetical protein